MENELNRALTERLEVEKAILEVRNMFADHEIILDKLRSCQDELKHTMLNSLMCLDFYRDLDAFLNDQRYSRVGNKDIQ